MNVETRALSRADLEAEVSRLQKINAALIERAESDDDRQHTDFGIFQATVLLEDQVRSRTRALDHALRQLEEANLALSQSRAELQAIFDVVPNPLAVSLLDDGTFIGVSHSFAEFFGIEPAEMIGKRAGSGDLELWSSDDDRAAFVAAIEAGQGRVTDVPLTLTSTPHGVAHLSVSARILEMEGRRLLLTEFHDVTAATRDTLRLRTLAEHDSLTGLPNRRHLLHHMSEAVDHARAAGGLVAICYLDLDGFKDVNDEGGHVAGDAVLVETGQRIVSTVRAGDTVARLGGDEFAIVLAGISGVDECEAVLQRTLDAITAPLESPGFAGAISASIGYTVFPDDDATPEQLLDHADRALYRAKDAGKARYLRYEG